MYTSGWPNTQNRCCHRSGSPPAVVSKKLVPKKRSKPNSMSPTVMTGKAVMTRNMVTRVIHMKRGMRMRVMPGARMLTMVTMKFSAAAVEETPRTARPST